MSKLFDDLLFIISEGQSAEKVHKINNVVCNVLQNEMKTLTKIFYVH